MIHRYPRKEVNSKPESREACLVHEVEVSDAREHIDDRPEWHTAATTLPSLQHALAASMFTLFSGLSPDIETEDPRNG